MSAKSKAEQYYAKLNIQDDKIKRKAEELIRLLDLKAPSGLPGKANSCKYVVCLHLACKLNNHPFDRATSFKCCGCEPFLYREAYALVTNILHIIIPLQFELICKEFDCPQLAKFVKKIFNRYKEIFTNSLPENRREDVHFDNPSYAAASFLLTAEYKKVKVDKKKLLEITDCRSKDFDQSYESINELIFMPLKMAETKAAELKADQNKAKVPEKINTGKSQTKESSIDPIDLNEHVIEEKRGEDFIRSKVNDILNVKQTEEDIQNMKLELTIDLDIDPDNNGTQTGTKILDKDFDDWVQEVLEERKMQKQLEQQQPQAAPKKQITLDLFVKKSDPKIAANLQAEEDLIDDDLKNISKKSKSNKERETKEVSSLVSSKRKSVSEKEPKSKKKAKKSSS